MAEYRVHRGLNYGPANKRAEPGDVVSDLPGDSIRHLLDRGHVTLESGSPPASVAPREPTKTELREEAESLGIDVPPRVTKDELVDLINEHQSEPELGEET